MVQPFFSVIIPTTLESKYLRNALNSIERQTLKDYEIIVCDYGSTDGTIQIAKEYGSRVISIRKAGASAAKNVASKIAAGRYLVFLDADTTMWQDCLALFKKEIEGGAIAGFPVVYWATDSKVYDLFRKAIVNPFYYISSVFGLRLAPANCMFCERDAFLQTDGFEENTPIFTNYNLNGEIKKFGGIKLVGKAKAFTSDRRVKDFGLPSYVFTLVYAFLMKVIKNRSMPLDFYKPVR